VRVATDFLVVGSGIAGLRAAADLANHGTVLILTKADPAESNTGYAQGGIAVALGADDSPALHAADTMAAGDGLCDEAAVRALVEDGVGSVRELVEWGARFDRTADGELAVGREAAHSVRRVLHAHDATGREIGRALWERVAHHPRVRVLNYTRATSLQVVSGRCVGARFSGPDGEGIVDSAATLVATGGAGQVFRETTNPAVATGDGIALAWRAGARVADLEFVQFHPTVLKVDGYPRALLSEALRGEGAWLVNADGERFMTRYEPAGELASRDLVSRAIVREARRTDKPIYLSLQHLDAEWIHKRFPTLSAFCRAAGLDLARDRIPVGPAAHYVMGGVESDLHARTTLPGLFVAGEVACTGVHGANRLASNSLLEGLVFGARAAMAMREPAQVGGLAGAREEPGLVDTENAGETHLPDEQTVRSLMWENVGLERRRGDLEQAVALLAQWRSGVDAALRRGALAEPVWRVASIVTVGSLVARAALRREETRGGHCRADFPARDDVNWNVHVGERIHVYNQTT
jgi:L-aspartate oxidase